eukprot:1193886-Prorocentrum_minimum.AAC.6
MKGTTAMFPVNTKYVHQSRKIMQVGHHLLNSTGVQIESTRQTFPIHSVPRGARDGYMKVSNYCDKLRDAAGSQAIKQKRGRSTMHVYSAETNEGRYNVWNKARLAYIAKMHNSCAYGKETYGIISQFW